MLNLNELQTILESVLPRNSNKLAERITKSINIYFFPVLAEINAIQHMKISDHEKAREMLKLVSVIPLSFVRDGQLVTLSSSGKIYMGNRRIEKELLEITFFAAYIGADDMMLSVIIEAYIDRLGDEADLQYKDYLISLCLKAREKFKCSLDCDRLVYF